MLRDLNSILDYIERLNELDTEVYRTIPTQVAASPGGSLSTQPRLTPVDLPSNSLEWCPHERPTVTHFERHEAPHSPRSSTEHDRTIGAIPDEPPSQSVVDSGAAGQGHLRTSQRLVPGP